MDWKEVTLLRNLPNCDQRLLDKFAIDFGFNRCAWYERPYSLAKLLAGKRSYNAGAQFDTPQTSWDWLDHGELYKIQGTPHIMAVGHDYGPDNRVYEGVKRVVEPLKLRAIVCSRDSSWYYPGETVLVMVMTPGTFDYFNDEITKRSDIKYTIQCPKSRLGARKEVYHATIND